jgi:hypothetical protein
MREHPRFVHADTLVVLLGWCSALGCSGAPLSQDQHFAAGTLTIADTGVQPGTDLVLPAFGTVVWRNGLGTSEPVDVTVTWPLGPSAACSTTVNFASDGSTSQAHVPPAGIAALCFHAPGRFAWTARSGTHEWHGTIVVQEKP